MGVVNKIILDQILNQLWKREITVDKASELIRVLTDDTKNVKSNDSGDFRDSQNYESQSQYYGR